MQARYEIQSSTSRLHPDTTFEPHFVLDSRFTNVHESLVDKRIKVITQFKSQMQSNAIAFGI